MTETLSLFCLLSGELMSNAFKVKLDINSDVSDLKKLIKAEKAPEFDDIAADRLKLWRVTIPIVAGNIHKAVVLNKIDSKTELVPTDEIPEAFKKTPPKKSVHIIIERLQGQDTEVAASRKQLSEVHDSAIDFGVVVKPERGVAFTWSTVVETATLNDLKNKLFAQYPRYAHDSYLEIFVYTIRPKPRRIHDNEDLRSILNVAKTTPKNKLTISLVTPTKSFSAWTFKDACDEYNLSDISDPGLGVISPFTETQAATLDDDFQKEICDRLITEVESRVSVFDLYGANESPRSIVVSSFLVAATRLSKQDLYLVAKRNLSGYRGNGPMDFSIHSQKDCTISLVVTVAKRGGFRQGVAQNMVQLESALTEKKQECERHNVNGEEEPPKKLRSYGIVTDATEWMFTECTMHEDETVSYRMTKLKETLNFNDKWQDDAKMVFGKLVWLWSLMRDEIPARESNSKEKISLLDDRQTP
ncbi:hypothetical protein BGZ50_002847 [Haplosporangium sp. Z 11]|nr:hypothetical protein BGZ50_002847 [Haplosporangium sp. Z 11]